MESSKSKILAYLKDGYSLTSLEALTMFGCLRLAARVFELREAGHNVIMVRETLETGKSVGRYTLLPPEGHVNN